MGYWQSFIYPNIPEDFIEQLTQENQKYVIVGVIGKSAYEDCNKMVGLNVLNCPPSLLDNSDNCHEGRITFYVNNEEKLLYLHFETSYDNNCMEKMLEKYINDMENDGYFMEFNTLVRIKFARMLIFAIQICHIIVFVETNTSFDASLITLFKSIKIIREKCILKFLPKLVKNSIGSFLGKDGRLCTPRFLFYFENYPDNYDLTEDDAISKLEFEVEDNIYKMLRNEFIITNNTSVSLFSIAPNKRFVYINSDKNLRFDPLIRSLNYFDELMDRVYDKNKIKMPLDDINVTTIIDDEYYGTFIPHCTDDEENEIEQEIDENLKPEKKPRQFIDLVNEHAEEALQGGFDDNLSRYRNKNHFVMPQLPAWLDTFKLLHKIFIENPDNLEFDTNDDPDYKYFLDNFNTIIDIDSEFFSKCREIGIKKAINFYSNPIATHYGTNFHNTLLNESIRTYQSYSKGPDHTDNIKKIEEECYEIWKNGKQQCEYPSLRGNPCGKPKHYTTDVSDHTSGVVFVAACNCGKIQGGREDPYTVRQANYNFYLMMENKCIGCQKIHDRYEFAIFKPSINDFRPAKFDSSLTKLYDENFPKFNVNSSDGPLSEYEDNENLSLGLPKPNDMKNIKIDCSSVDDSMNELVIKIGDNLHNDKEQLALASTTEYLPGMLHTESPSGLLPQFPSWSLVCVGPSSVYSHSSGLTEHFQSGFLGGSNFLLPWDVHVRIEHSETWAISEKTRYRKKGEVIKLKIFIGCEYECPCGHRFIMSSPDKVVRGGSGIEKNCGSKVVFNDMPLYFPCACKSTNNKPMVAQLMRIHIVTPKAPVNVILDPKIRSADRNYIFTLGTTNLPKLSQSAYWVLRLPYIYQPDNVPIHPPMDITTSTAMSHGCLLAGMYGVSETENDLF